MNRNILLLCAFYVAVLSISSVVTQCSPGEKKRTNLVVNSKAQIDSIVIAFKEQYDAASSNPLRDSTTELTIQQFYDPETYVFGNGFIKEFSEISECSGDSVYRYYYGNTGYIEGELVRNVFVMNDFSPFIIGIHPGMSQAEVKQVLGKPRIDSESFLTYAVFDELESANSDRRYVHDGIRMLFGKSGLRAVWFVFKMSC